MTTNPSPPLVPADFNADLHAYTFSGLHTGKNYTTGLFDLQIPGSNISPSPGAGPEVIAIPANTTAFFTVDPTPALRWLDAYNQIAPSRGLPLIQPQNTNLTVALAAVRYDSAGNRTESSPVFLNVTLDRPRVVAVPARVSVEPETLNLKSEGKFVTVEINITGYG